jgi:undecaprenyl-diphosphatase
MLSSNGLINIFLPVLSHWVVWLIFLVVAILISLLSAYPYIKKPGKEFHKYQVVIPVVNIISLYIFTKMLEGVIYEGSVLKVDAWFNKIIYLPWINSAALFITNFGSAIVVTVLFIVALGILLLRKRWHYALLSTVAILGALVLPPAIKAIVQRARPQNLIETGFSFPSGHAITAIIFVSLLIYSFKDDFKNKIARYILIIASLALFISVGISRMIIHVHWFSDVIGGMSLGLFWFTLVVIIERSITGLIPAIKRETKEAKPIVPKKYICWRSSLV